MRRHPLTLATGALAATLALSACQSAGPVGAGLSTSPTPKPRAVSANLVPSAESLALVNYYASVQRSLLTQGLLRTDGGGADVPFSAAMLARNFERIAFFQEYSQAGGRLVARENASRLTRWEKPVRVSVHFGLSTPDDKKMRDRAVLSRYVRRLARVTGHSISMTNGEGNFRVYILNEDERKAFGSELRRIVPGISALSQRAVINMPRDTYCLVFGRDPENNGRFEQAVAVIRSEHPDLMRTSCIHEEVAQGLGLSNDSPQARPSIFNDDEEFGLLTTHDENLLRMLYDDRLRPNMTAEEARPIIKQIAAELTGGAV
ncbi:hypothetical protein GCM10016455_20390 [Aliiroseovarius zhejiangensis]|uniref:DUF2927 domain-containing protein n=1 Tax=Aliiroseovarius zhejiangensis TaxID=1632025 RepID=A0ABQ3J1M2_9RHOB|nr:DUF2927 domain-containing protein [Aliiroseovarius zhejiangensis]GHE99544.1 hypothetical protein GCM10016455_20390 [Aliiroseovarius zhejiangensis]